MISYCTTYILVKKAQEMFCLVICGWCVSKFKCPSPNICINPPIIITWWIPSNFFVLYIKVKSKWILIVRISNYANVYPGKLTLKLLKQLLFKICLQCAEFLFVNLNIIDSQYDFPSTLTGMANFCSIIWLKLFLSSLHLLHFVGRILFDGQMASRKCDTTACWLIWSVIVKLFLFRCSNNIFTPACICWQHSISDAIELRKLFLEVFNFLLLFLNHYYIWWIKLDIPQWCRSRIWGPTWWCCMRGCFRIFHDYAKKWGFVQPF